MADESIQNARFDYKQRENMTPGQIVTMFNDFAEDYDQDAIEGHDFQSPPAIVNCLTQSFNAKQRSEIKVLDVAAGTGVIGVMLKKEGFAHIDALDPAEKMLEVAKAKGVYERFFCDYMDGRRIPGIDTDYYDAMTVCGGFNIGLIPLKAFSEIIRVVKPGGLFVTAIANKNLERGYKGEFLPFLSKMEDEGLWEKVAHFHLKDGQVGYKGSGPGILYVYRIKVSEATAQRPLPVPLLNAR